MNLFSFLFNFLGIRFLSISGVLIVRSKEPLSIPEIFWMESEIKSPAEEIAGKAKRPIDKAEKLTRWVFKNIDKEFRVTIPSAAEVLKSRKGDCNEHSTLLAAMGRSLGIPTKICTGLLYQEGAFWYHAWNEVLVSSDPEIWWPLDSTIGGNYVDATHIKLAEGNLFDENSSLGKVMGKISLEILEVKY